MGAFGMIILSVHIWSISVFHATSSDHHFMTNTDYSTDLEITIDDYAQIEKRTNKDTVINENASGSTSDNIIISSSILDTNRIPDVKKLKGKHPIQNLATVEPPLNSLQILARKDLKNERRPKPPALTLGAFVHLGKTGGSSISSNLLRYGCHSFVVKECDRVKMIEMDWNALNEMRKKETAVSKLTTYYHVPDFNNHETRGLFGKGKGLKHEFYLFTLRDPLDRTISAFLYQHPFNTIAEKFQRMKTHMSGKYRRMLKRFGSEQAVRRQFELDFHNLNAGTNGHLLSVMKEVKILNIFYSCTPTLEDFATLLGDESNGECGRVAKRSYSEYSNVTHLKHSMTYLSQNLNLGDPLVNKTILVARMEHLDEDWIHANRYLGQEGGDREIMLPKKLLRDSSKVERPVSSNLSEEGRKKICLSLNKEYNVYFGMLNQAVNLTPGDVAKSLAIAQKNCPWLDFTFNSIPQSIAEARP